jgi:NDP-sugar pyrophosphorylase family protein
MKTKIHYIMPMAGRGSRFSKQGYDFPKPLIEIYGKPFFFWSTQSVRKFIELASLDFVVLQEHIDKYNIDQEIIKYFPEAKIHALPEVTEGAVITCMKGIVDIDDDLPVLFNDCDHLFKSVEFNSFCNENFDVSIDGILLTFLSDEAKFSFVGKDEKGYVTRTVEKEVISDEAICGCYYFRDKNMFVNVAEKYLTKCNYSEYFMSGVYNIMLDNGQIVKSIKTDFHIPFGVPEEYEEAKKTKEYEELI